MLARIQTINNAIHETMTSDSIDIIDPHDELEDVKDQQCRSVKLIKLFVRFTVRLVCSEQSRRC